MTDLPVFRRDVLAKAFGGNPALVSAFEQLVDYVTQAAGQATSGAAAMTAIGEAPVLTLVGGTEFASGRIFTAGEGIEAVDDGDRLTVGLNDLTPKVDGGFPVMFIVTGATNLILPLIGMVATMADLAAAVAGSVTAFNTRTGAVTLLSADVTGALGFTPYDAANPSGYITGITSAMVTTALGYTPTSVTGLTGTQSVAAFKTGLSLVKGDVGLGNVDNTSDANKPVSTAQQTALDLKLDDSQAGAFGLTLLGTADLAAAKTALAYVKADVGLGSVDNTADAAKNVLSATKLTTARNINGVAFDGTGNITINAVDSTARVAETRTINTTAPLTGGGDLSANRTLAITAASGAAAGSMSAADKSKLDAISGTNTGDAGTVTTVSVVTANGVSGSVANATTTPAVTLTLGAITPSSVASTGPGTFTGLVESNGAAGGFTVKDRDGTGSWIVYNSGGVLRFFENEAVGDNIICFQAAAPASAGATGVAGTISWDTGFIYICTATNTWKRVAIATW